MHTGVVTFLSRHLTELELHGMVTSGPSSSSGSRKDTSRLASHCVIVAMTRSGIGLYHLISCLFGKIEDLFCLRLPNTNVLRCRTCTSSPQHWCVGVTLLTDLQGIGSCLRVFIGTIPSRIASTKPAQRNNGLRCTGYQNGLMPHCCGLKPERIYWRQQATLLSTYI